MSSTVISAAQILEQIRNLPEDLRSFDGTKTDPALYGVLREREERVRARAELDAKTLIIRQLGHDLRTPLSQVAKYAYLIEHDPRKPLEELDPRMEGIKRGLNRMGDLIRQIRELRSTSVVANEWRSLKGEALEIVRSFWKLNDFVNERGHRLVLEEGGSRLYSRVTFIHLFQILDNLLLNAVDAIAKTPNGTVRISFYDDADGSRLAVSDNGVGVASADLERILEVDFTTKPAKGTGLGLAIVRRICSDYGLSISVESDVGRGTTFTVHFPKPPTGSVTIAEG